MSILSQHTLHCPSCQVSCNTCSPHFLIFCTIHPGYTIHNLWTSHFYYTQPLFLSATPILQVFAPDSAVGTAIPSYNFLFTFLPNVLVFNSLFLPLNTIPASFLYALTSGSTPPFSPTANSRHFKYLSSPLPTPQYSPLHSSYLPPASLKHLISILLFPTLTFSFLLLHPHPNSSINLMNNSVVAIVMQFHPQIVINSHSILYPLLLLHLILYLTFLLYHNFPHHTTPILMLNSHCHIIHP